MDSDSLYQSQQDKKKEQSGCLLHFDVSFGSWNWIVTDAGVDAGKFNTVLLMNNEHPRAGHRHQNFVPTASASTSFNSQIRCDALDRNLWNLVCLC